MLRSTLWIWGKLKKLYLVFLYTYPASGSCFAVGKLAPAKREMAQSRTQDILLIQLHVHNFFNKLFCFPEKG